MLLSTNLLFRNLGPCCMAAGLIGVAVRDTALIGVVAMMYCAVGMVLKMCWLWTTGIVGGCAIIAPGVWGRGGVGI